MAYKDIDGQMDLFENGFLDSLIAEYAEKEKSAPSKASKVSNKASKSGNKVVEIKSTPKQSAPKSKPENKSNTKAESKGVVVQFPKPVPEVEVKLTDGNATYEDCERKLNKEREKFVGSNNEYVINGILELCKVDSNFRNRVMLPEKSYAGFFDYMATKAQAGIGAYIIGGNKASMDDDTALGMSFDYFNS